MCLGSPEDEISQKWNSRKLTLSKRRPMKMAPAPLHRSRKLINFYVLCVNIGGRMKKLYAAKDWRRKQITGRKWATWPNYLLTAHGGVQPSLNMWWQHPLISHNADDSSAVCCRFVRENGVRWEGRLIHFPPHGTKSPEAGRKRQKGTLLILYQKVEIVFYWFNDYSDHAF